MDIKNIKKIIELCKRNGIEYIKIDNLELRFDLMHSSQQVVRKQANTTTSPIFSPGGVNQDTKIETEELSEDDLLFWSAGVPQ